MTCDLDFGGSAKCCGTPPRVANGPDGRIRGLQLEPGRTFPIILPCPGQFAMPVVGNIFATKPPRYSSILLRIWSLDHRRNVINPRHLVLRGDGQDLAVVRQGHAMRFDADLDGIERLAARHIPKGYDAVGASGSEDLAVVAEREPAHQLV